ncbi:MAG: propionyl-CoA carboxylase, partial [Rhodospirillaceae bacterium]|nr:propionyl-CoA carboxylase [Rhodospirillaceae bacterium]
MSSDKQNGDPQNWDKEIAEIHERRALAKGHGGEEAVALHHAKGRMTLRERIDSLIDPGSFKETGMGAGGAEKDESGNLTGFTPSNFILGFAQVDERPIIVGGEDFTIGGGSPTVAG